jgi:hypothetical protein
MKTSTKIVAGIGLVGIGVGAVMMAPELFTAAALAIGGRLLLSRAGKVLAKSTTPRIVTSAAATILGTHGARERNK